jgi:DNA-binding MarR family transcriptional regulator
LLTKINIVAYATIYKFIYICAYLEIMDIEINKSDFNKTIAPWIGKTFKMMNMYICTVFQKNNIQVTKEQWIVLKILHEDNDGVFQNELAFITSRNKASLTRLINVMEKNNLVARISSKEDSRKNLIYITKNGKKLFLKMKPIMLKSIKIAQEGITEEEMKVFFKIMTKIQNNLKNNTI